MTYIVYSDDQKSHAIWGWARYVHHSDYTTTGPMRIYHHLDEISDDARQSFLYFIA